MAEVRNCSVDGCERPRYARQELCEAHYRRKRRTGDISEDRPIGGVSLRPCTVEGCPNISTERDLCHGHYLRLIRVGDVRADRPLGRRVNDMCIVDGCERPAVNLALRILAGSEGHWTTIEPRTRQLGLPA
jgi:hypothetical protein